jgi:hypothetical protein
VWFFAATASNLIIFHNIRVDEGIVQCSFVTPTLSVGYTENA